MNRLAIFIDAGYLFAQGSVALTGQKKERKLLSLDERAVVNLLIDAAQKQSKNDSVLRLYWYDAAPIHAGPTLQHKNLALMDNVKLRLGYLNSQNQQKGVDSLIVTDMIELARNHAISDAAILSGDEDVRVGVQIAQNFGVRVHLIGIAPCRGSQSPQLMQEADTTLEWNKATVETFLKLQHHQETQLSGISEEAKGQQINLASSQNTTLNDVASQFAFSLDITEVGKLERPAIILTQFRWVRACAPSRKAAISDAAHRLSSLTPQAPAQTQPGGLGAFSRAIRCETLTVNHTAARSAPVAREKSSQRNASELSQAALSEHWSAQSDIPPEFDGKLLAKGRAAAGRDLSLEEKRFIRSHFKSSVRSR
ncbi:MAG: NYN domain-containing protein [Rhodospirillales bacterium]|nr:NYN domain-containing protein [Rhodospirillales bacterium]